MLKNFAILNYWFNFVTKIKGKSMSFQTNTQK